MSEPIVRKVFALVALATATPTVAVVPGVAVGSLPRLYFARLRATRFAHVGVVPDLEVVKAELADPTSEGAVEVLVLAQQIATDALEQKLNARAVRAAVAGAPPPHRPTRALPRLLQSLALPSPPSLP